MADPRPWPFPTHRKRRRRWVIPTVVAAAVILIACFAGAVGSILAASDPDSDTDPTAEAGSTGPGGNQEDQAGQRACLRLVSNADEGVLGVVARNSVQELGDQDWAQWIADVRSIGTLAARSDRPRIAGIGEDIDAATAGATANPQELVLLTLDLADACATVGHVDTTDVADALGEVNDSGDQPAEAAPADITDGVWTVGVDVEPGTYRPVADASGDCYWAVLVSGSNGGDIVANSIGGGRPVVTLADGQDFETNRCGGWAKINLERLMADADPATSIGDGMWTVGLDIAAGTWRPAQPAGGDCYWAVLAGGTNADEIIDNGLGGGRPAVTVSRGQVFEVSRCGTWQRD
jgi:hypothetical protein